tara:strand:+ start:1510 stop:1674 length:165 start_codon:yes stop_codon:yes gene_type:complete
MNSLDDKDDPEQLVDKIGSEDIPEDIKKFTDDLLEDVKDKIDEQQEEQKEELEP